MVGGLSNEILFSILRFAVALDFDFLFILPLPLTDRGNAVGSAELDFS